MGRLNGELKCLMIPLICVFLSFGESFLSFFSDFVYKLAVYHFSVVWYLIMNIF